MCFHINLTCSASFQAKGKYDHYFLNIYSIRRGSKRNTYLLRRLVLHISKKGYVSFGMKRVGKPQYSSKNWSVQMDMEEGGNMGGTTFSCASHVGRPTLLIMCSIINQMPTNYYSSSNSPLIFQSYVGYHICLNHTFSN